MVGYIGLGSNVGEREEQLRRAVEDLRRPGIGVEAVSSLYETEPVGEILDQPDFLNAAVRVSTELEPEELLDLCKAIEAEHGRAFGGPRHGPRPIDLDLLLLGDLELSTERLDPAPPGGHLAALRARSAARARSRARAAGRDAAAATHWQALGPGQRVSRVGPLRP